MSLYDLQTACYHSLQRVLVLLGQENHALVVAERSRTRPFLDLLRDRQNNKWRVSQKFDGSTPKSVADIEKIVNRQKAVVLYYSLAGGYLYSWLLVPNEGIIKFHQTCLAPQEEETQHSAGPEDRKEGFLLESYIENVRESLGINPEATEADEAGEEDGGVWSNHLEELGDKLNQDGDRTGFLRLVNRSSRLNASSYSLSSLFSVGSVGGTSTVSGLASSRLGSSRSRRYGWQGHSSLRNLYQLLIEPLEDDLPEAPTELMLVLEGDLYLVPFPVLKGSNCSDYLCERFNILVCPSLTASKTRFPKAKQEKEGTAVTKLVVGNPKIPTSVTEHWGWGDIHHAEQEANIVSEILETSPVVGQEATKETLLARLEEAECVHMACHVSWKLSAIIVSPPEFMESRSPGSSSGNPRRYSIHSDTIHEEEDVRSEATTIELPALSEFLLTAADLLGLKMSAKLVVISSCYSRDKAGTATSDGVIGLSRALLAAGAQCVLLSLWPVPETAVKLIMKAFYSSLLQGARASKALSEAMMAVQTTKYFQHPANWAGFVLIGQDVKLSDKVALMGQALREIISAHDRCRDALRVTLHLVITPQPA